MRYKKAVPHMTLLIQIVKNKDSMLEFLKALSNREHTQDDAVERLLNIKGIKLSKKSAERYIGSLKTYYFLELTKTGFLRPSPISEEFMSGALKYDEYILKLISRNIEWFYFLPDIVDIVDKGIKPISRQNFFNALEIYGYFIGASEKRYISEILKILDIAKVWTYKGGMISGLKKERNEILFYVRKNQSQMLDLLLMAEKRLSKPELRKIYRATVHSYLPLRENRNEIEKIQEEIDEIRSKGIKEQAKRIEYSGKSKWELKDNLYEWQEDFVNRWMKEKNGIVEVVTGAGKTHMAMSVMERMKREFSDLKVTIIVPTIVLLEQWYQNLVYKLQISPEEIGLRGGGYKDNFEGKNVLICVINSAIRNDFIEKATQGLSHNLLIADECHRAGAKEFRKIFKARRDWNLGLSATPERETDNAFEEVLEKELGHIIGRFTYVDALEKGIIPRFNIYNYAVLLTREEQRKYDSLTREIQKIVLRIKRKYPKTDKTKNFEMYLKNLQKRHPEDRDLFLYFQKTKERKELVYGAENRKKLVTLILKKILEDKGKGATPPTSEDADSPLDKLNGADKAIIFHEKIDEINALYFEIPNTFVSIYHSGLPHSVNRIGMDLYKLDQMKVLLSVKALIEGVDVPKANVGVIMASSSSQTQRIQSLGRVLRRAEGKDETNLFIIYVKDTTDERIYLKTDWDKIIGKGNVEYRMWTDYGEVPIEPPQQKGRKEIEVKEDDLVPGMEYLGKYDGEVFSFDSRGRMFRKTKEGREYLNVHAYPLWKEYRKYKPSGGRFTITKEGRVLIKANKNGKLKTIYLGKIERDFGINLAEKR